ncbi:phage protein [Streptococcus pyogenes]|nr:phage protein [Streptococcus pyogenes]
MLKLSIENIIKSMKTQGKTRVTGSIGDQAIRIDLDGLVIHYNGQGLLLETIPGTYGGKRYFFVCPDCERRCRKLFKVSHALLVVLVRRFIKPRSIEARQTVATTGN